MTELKINDKTLKLHFGLHVSEMLVQDANPKSTVEFMATLVYLAHENYCLGWDAVKQVTRGEIFRWIEGNMHNNEAANALKAVIDDYTASKPAQAILSAASEADKKKLVGEASEPLPSE